MNKLTLEDLAGQLFFGIIKNEAQLKEKIKGQWHFRKNKTISDVNNALTKGKKIGMGKTEMELDGVALYLKDVFKKDRTTHN